MNAKTKTKTKKAARLLVLLAAAPFMMANDCEKPLVEDSGFDVWCGDTLCAWQLDEGTIQRAPTWHESDYGVALTSDPTQISQFLPNGSEIACLHVKLLADVEASANAELITDFDDDGTPEYTQRFAEGTWILLEYHLSAPLYYRGVRVKIRKHGPGHAELARIEIDSAQAADCPDPRPLGRSDRPAGAACTEATDCHGTACLPRAPAEGASGDACEACGSDADCAAAPGGASVCGLAFDPIFLAPYRACVPPASRVLGDRCVAAGECATGVCCGGVCSACCDGTSSYALGAATVACGRAVGICGVRAGKWGAWQCAPGERLGAPGTVCLDDDDCASGVCAGGPPFAVCKSDGRRCSGDAECPGTSAPDKPCIAIGIAGGQCR